MTSFSVLVAPPLTLHFIACSRSTRARSGETFYSHPHQPFIVILPDWIVLMPLSYSPSLPPLPKTVSVILSMAVQVNVSIAGDKDNVSRVGIWRDRGNFSASGEAEAIFHCTLFLIFLFLICLCPTLVGVASLRGYWCGRCEIMLNVLWVA